MNKVELISKERSLPVNPFFLYHMTPTTHNVNIKLLAALEPKPMLWNEVLNIFDPLVA